MAFEEAVFSLHPFGVIEKSLQALHSIAKNR
jgi:hypothetical protein